MVYWSLGDKGCIQAERSANENVITIPAAPELNSVHKKQGFMHGMNTAYRRQVQSFAPWFYIIQATVLIEVFDVIHLQEGYQ